MEQVTTPDLVSYPMMGTLDERGRLFLCESSGNTLDNEQMAAHPEAQIIFGAVIDEHMGDALRAFGDGQILRAAGHSGASVAIFRFRIGIRHVHPA